MLFVETAVQPGERGHQVGLVLEHRPQGVVLQLLHPRRDGPDRERADVQPRGHLAPGEGSGYRGAGERTDAERRDEQAPVPVLHVVEVHLAAPLLDLTGDGGDVGEPGRDDSRQESAEGAGLLVGDLAAQRNQRSEEHTSELQSLAYLVCRLLLEKKKNNTSRYSE